MSSIITSISDALSLVDPNLRFALLIIGVILIIVLFIVILWVLYKLIGYLWTALVAVSRYGATHASAAWERRKAEPTDDEPLPILRAIGPQEAEATTLDVSLRRLIRLLNRLGRSTDPYSLPWYMMIGDPGSGKSMLLRDSGLGFPFGTTEMAVDADCLWWVTGEAVVVEPRGRLLRTGRSSRKFEQLIKEITQQRPQRPLDGIILTIPLRLLESNAENPESLMDEAQRWSEAFSACEHQLGFRLPVYIVVTQLDEKKSFSLFAKSLNDLQARGIFGWSNPYHIDEPFERSWLDEAFQLLERDITNLWITQPSSVQASSAGIHLPAYLWNMKETLAFLCNRLFRSGRYFQSFSFRGLYFTGRTDSATEKTGKRYFLTDMFVDKILPERGIARPLAFRLETATRKYRRLMIGSMIGITFVFSTTIIGLSQTVATVDNVKTTLNSMEKEIDESWSPVSTAELTVTPEPTIIARIIDTLLRLENEELFHPFLIPSWFSTIPVQIEQLVATSMRGYIFGHLRESLNTKLHFAVSPASAFDARQRQLDQSEIEITHLRRFIDSLADAENYLTRYEELTQEFNKNISLEQLLDYTFGGDLRWPGDLQQILSHTAIDLIALEPIERPVLREEAIMSMRQLIEDYISFTFTNNELTLAALEVQTLSQTIINQPDNVRLEDIRLLHTNLKKIEALLERSKMTWIVADKPRTNRAFDQILGRIIANPFLGLQVATEIRIDTLQQRNDARSRIVTFESPFFGNVLVRQNPTEGGEGILVIPEETKNFTRALGFFLLSPFLQGETNQRLDQVTTDDPFTWNLQHLIIAVRKNEAYDTYFAAPNTALGVELQAILQRVSGQYLALILENAVTEAIVYRPSLQSHFGAIDIERGLVEALLNFTQARSRLESVIATLQLQAPERADSLLQVLSRQVVSLLVQAHTLLRQENPYGFLRTALSATDTDTFNEVAIVGLEDRLNEARERLQILYDQFARSTLDILEQRRDIFSRRDLRQVDDWQAINRALLGYEQSETNNPIVEIERIARLLTLSDGLQLCQSADALATDRPRSTGYIGTVLGRSIQALLARCANWRANQTQTALSDFENFYRNSVEGAYPFNTVERSTGPLPLDVFTELLQRYGTLKETLNTLGPWIQINDEWEIFIQKIEQVYNFFPPGDNPQEIIDVHLEFSLKFRTNESNSNLVEQIIEWQMRTANNVLTDRQENRIQTWRYGEPVTLSVRWAQDSPYRPQLSSTVTLGGGWRLINDQTIESAFLGPWSFFAFLDFYQVHQEAEQGGALLRVAIPSYRLEDQEEDTLLAFLEMRFYDGGTPITLPRFPFPAPTTPAIVTLQADGTTILPRTNAAN